MSKHTIDPDLQSVQDLAWSIKDACDDLSLKKISGPDRAALQSVERDLKRMLDRVLAIRDKRKRAGTDDDALTHPVLAQPALGNDNAAPSEAG
jgi:hypothetical protein